MVTSRNDSIELAVVKDPMLLKHPDQSAPPADELRLKRRQRRRKRCWTVVTLVVVLLIAIGTGTILFYEHLLGWLPADSNGHDYQPTPTEKAVVIAQVVTDRAPVMIDPYSEEPASSTPSDVIFIDSTTDGGRDEPLIFINSKEESVDDSSEDAVTSNEEHDGRAGSGDYNEEASESVEEEGASGSGDGFGRD